MSEQRPLQTPGEMLAQARQRRSSTVEQVAATTKIPINILQAIELDEYHKLSDPLYIKSFLRTYAQHVGLDHEAVLRVYEEFAGEKTAAAGTDESVWEEEVSVQRVGLPWGRIMVGAALAAALIAVILLLSLRGCEQEESGESRRAPAEQASSGVDEAESSMEPVPDTDAARTEPDAAESTTDSPVAGSETAGTGMARTDRPDTLALGWQESSEQAPVATDVPQEATVDRQQPLTQPTAADDQASAAPTGPEVVFADGRSWDLVMRLFCPEPVGVAVQRDAERDFRIVYWPADAPRLSESLRAGLDHGRAYAVPGGLVVYWGASDHFVLRLDQIQGVQVMVNGSERDVSSWSPGDEMFLTGGQSSSVPSH